LRGIEFSGRMGVVYSSEDLSVGLVGHPVDGITGYEPKSAEQLAANLLLHSAKIKLNAPAVAAAPGARNKMDLTKQLEQFAPGWKAENCGPEGGYREEWFGKKGVLTTHPLNQTTPCVLTKDITVPRQRTTVLKVTVGRHQQGDWDLVVKVDGQEVKKQPVSAATTSAGGGWLEVPIDLSPHSGKVVKVQLINQPTGWSNEHAYWSEIKVE
jgi:hypothetical protein